MNSVPRTRFRRLKAALEEGIRHARGELKLRTTVLSSPPPKLRARDVIQLRQRFHMTQRMFACALNVSPKTVQSWEQGSRRPSQAALRLLQVLCLRPEVIIEVVGQPTSAPRQMRVAE